MRGFSRQTGRAWLCVFFATFCLALVVTNPAGAATFESDRVAKVAEPRLMVVAPDAGLWILARPRLEDGNDNRFRLYRFDRRGKRRRVEVPLGGWIQTGWEAAIAVGVDGNIWVSIARATRGGRTAILRYSLTGRRLSTWYLPLSAQVRSMTAAPDGRMWVLGASKRKYAKLTVGGKLTFEPSLETAKSDFFVQGAQGDMWAVRPGMAIRITENGTRRRVSLPRWVDGATVSARGSDGAMWFNAAGRLIRVGQDLTFTEIPLVYRSNKPPPTEEFVRSQRSPISIMLRADGRIGFAATFLTQDREATWSGDTSIGAVDESGFAEETVPGIRGMGLYYEEYYEDPANEEAGFGQGRMLASPDGRFWVMSQFGESPGAWRFNLDRDVRLVTARPRFDSIRIRGRSVAARLSCQGSPGKFCFGTVSMQVGRRSTRSRKQYAIAVGDTSTVRFRVSRRLDRGQIVRMVSSTFDAIDRKRTTVAASRRAR